METLINNIFNFVAAYATLENILMIVMIIAIFIMVITYVIASKEEHKKARMYYDAIFQIRNDLETIRRYSQSTNDRVGNMKNPIKRIESKLGNYRTEVLDHYNKDNDQYNKNLELITQDIDNLEKALKSVEQRNGILIREETVHKIIDEIFANDNSEKPKGETENEKFIYSVYRENDTEKFEFVFKNKDDALKCKDRLIGMYPNEKIEMKPHILRLKYS